MSILLQFAAGLAVVVVLVVAIARIQGRAGEGEADRPKDRWHGGPGGGVEAVRE